MKHLKLLGLIAVAAMAAMSFFGAGSASAGVWCKTVPVEDKCPAGWDFAVGHEITLSLKAGTTAVLKAAFSEVKCAKAHLKLHVTRTGEKEIRPKAQGTQSTFEECTCGERIAHVTATEFGEIDESDTGTVTSYSARTTFQCTGLGSCIFGTVAAGTDIGSLTDSGETGAEAELDMSATLTWSSGTGDSGQFVCAGFGDTASMSGNYQLTKPTPLLRRAKE